MATALVRATFLLVLVVPLTLAASGGPSIAITAPADGQYVQVAPEDPNASVTVEFAVSGWAYPATGKAVLVGLDAPPALLSTGGPGPVVVAPVPPGQHTLWVCLATEGPGGLQPIDADPDVAGVQAACASIQVKVSLVNCWPTVYEPSSGTYICDPAQPQACCLDQNPCSVDNCQWVTSGGLNQYECRFAPVTGPCCQSFLECPAGHDCDPATHQCAPGEPAAVDWNPVPVVVEPGPEVVEAGPEASPEPAVEVSEPVPEASTGEAPYEVNVSVDGCCAPDQGPDAALSEGPEPLDASPEAADDLAPGTSADDDPTGAGSGGCAWPAARPSASGALALLVAFALLTRRRRSSVRELMAR